MDYLSITYEGLELFVAFDSDGAFEGVYSLGRRRPNGTWTYNCLDGVFTDGALAKIEEIGHEAFLQADEDARAEAAEMRYAE